MSVVHTRKAGNPRSESTAIQSLDGHGLAVIPVSWLSDGSDGGATPGYSTAQLPVPTPNAG